MRTGLATDPLFTSHDTGPGHPERPERLSALQREIEDLDLVPVEARDAAFEELTAVHEPEYVRGLERSIAAGATALEADTLVGPTSYRAAVRAAGAGLALAEALVDGRIEAGFAAVRPPGHHACRAKAMGFCLLNNAAILARFLDRHGKSVCIVDWDVHHGNGTQEIFQSAPEVGYCSLHQWPLYPGTGAAAETGAGNLLNLPLPEGSDDVRYGAAFEDVVVPWIEERNPDVVVVSAGFDAHRLDPLGGMALPSDAFAAFTRRLARRPVLSVLDSMTF